jgi:putative transcriptional regulator
MYHYKESGLGNIKLLNGYKLHDTPYGKSVTIADIKGLHKQIGTALINKQGLLTNEEVRFLRTELGLSQKALAQTLSVAEITVRGWESGKAKISGPADRLLRVLYKDYTDPDSLARELVDQLAKLDAQVRKSVKQLRFEVADNEWVRQRAG